MILVPYLSHYSVFTGNSLNTFEDTEQCCGRRELKVKMADELRLYSRVKGPAGRGKPDGKSECGPAREAAGTPAAGSVNWLSYLENWNYLLSCTYETPGSSNFTLRNVLNRNAYMRPPTCRCWRVRSSSV